MTRRNLYLVLALLLAALAGIWGYSNNKQLQISRGENIALKDSIQTLLLENNRLEGALTAYTNAYELLAAAAQQQNGGSQPSPYNPALAASTGGATRSTTGPDQLTTVSTSAGPAVPPANAEQFAANRSSNQSASPASTTPTAAIEQERAELAAENEQLNEELSAVQTVNAELAAERDAALNAQQELASTLEEVQEEKEELATELTEVQEEKEQLETQQLQMTQVSDRMRRRLEQMSVNDLRASDFQVSLLKDVNGRLTTRANRVKQIVVSFLLNEVPERYQTTQALFLVVTDSSGNPVTGEHPIKVQSRINGNVVELLALTGRDVDLQEMQRVAFNQELNWRALRPGNYRVQVFTNFGLLGTAGFAVE